MRSALWPDESGSDLAHQIETFLHGADPQSSFLSAVFVSESASGELTGFIELFIRNYAEGCTGATPYVEGWYVDPDIRGSGVGRALMGAAEAWAQSSGFTEFASDTPLENEASQRAHRALGFDEVELIVHYRKSL